MLNRGILGFLVAASIVTAIVPAAVAQTWTVSGSSLCFNYGQVSQCSTSASIQQVVSQPSQFEQQYATGYAAGQAIGGLSQSIAKAWAEHRARVNEERTDARSQLQTYSDAAVALMREDLEIQTATLSLYDELRQINPAQASTYDEGAAISRELFEREKQAVEQTPKNIAIIAKAKNLKFLRENAEMQKKLYNTVYGIVTRSYVWEQLLIASKTGMGSTDFVGSPGLRTAALNNSVPSPLNQPPTSSRSTPQDLFVWFDEP
jgi:hypothetical protein